MNYEVVQGPDTGLALAGSIMLVYSVVMIAVAVFAIACMWKLFTKAGKPGWAAIVPIYNSYVLFEIAWGNGLWCFASFIPVIGFVFPLICYHKLAQSFGKGIGTTIGLIVLPIIFLPMLAFGKDAYIGPAA